MSRIALIGRRGQLGTDLEAVLRARGHIVEPLDRPGFDLRDRAAMEARLRAIAPERVVNLAAYHRVDACEVDWQEAFEVNAVAVRSLALVCRELDAPLLHVSTDYVFGADRGRRLPYTEADTPGPVNVYGTSKLAGEHLLAASWQKHFIVRTSGLYGRAQSRTKGSNFVEIVLARAPDRLRVVADQILAPTSTADLAPKLEEILRTNAYGTYHMTNGGECSWFEFAQAVLDLAGARTEVTPITTEAWGAPAERPRYSVLDNSKAGTLGLSSLRPWRDALAGYLESTGRR